MSDKSVRQYIVIQTEVVYNSGSSHVKNLLPPFKVQTHNSLFKFKSLVSFPFWEIATFHIISPTLSYGWSLLTLSRKHHPDYDCDCGLNHLSIVRCPLLFSDFCSFSLLFPTNVTR
jgi:hypothetical protein